MPGGGVYYQGRFHLLYIKMNSIQMLDQVQSKDEPNFLESVRICEKVGCDGISVHIEDDMGKVQVKDVRAIKNVFHGKLNLEMVLSDKMSDNALKAKPDKLVIVPEKSQGVAGYGALGIRANMSAIKDAVKVLHDRDLLVSVSIRPDMQTIELIRECEADFIQIDTGAYGRATTKSEAAREIERIYNVANQAVKNGIKVSAGNRLNYDNITPVLKARALEEVTIGDSIIPRAVHVGLQKAVEEMLEALE